MTTLRSTAILAATSLIGAGLALAIPEPTPIADVTASTPIIGVPRVVDGDTLAFGEVRVRLWGIDAFEAHQTCSTSDGTVTHSYSCGLAATNTLANAVLNAHVTCTERDRDRYGRIVAVCTAPGVGDLARLMVLRGWAFDWPRYSHGAYKDVQDAAHEVGRGAWHGTFEYPWDYRAKRGGAGQ